MGAIDLILILILGFGVGTLLTYFEIPILKNHQLKQYIREEGPESHQKKSGTPTMGGVAIAISIVVTTVVSGFLLPLKGEKTGLTGETVVMLVVMLLFCAIGFADDFIKVSKKHNLGLRAWQKLLLQVLFGVGLALYISKVGDYGTKVFIPFYGDYVDFGALYVPFVAFVIVAMANSVNLNDGLDGLCSGVTAIVSIFFAIVGIKLGANAPMIFCSAIAGTCLGFLVFNKNPAKLFMGDTGSMALGGGLAAAVIMMKMEFLLVIAGFVYVMESLSVILQVISFQTTGKRIFRMSPIHHHFELGGMEEKNVVYMFWGVTAACSLLAYIIFVL